MNLIVLQSGSAGNAVFVESADSGAAVLLDCGISARQIDTRLRIHGRFSSSIRGVFITHEHGDHVRGVATFSKRHRIPVHATIPTLRRMTRLDGGGAFRPMEHGQPVQVEDLEITAWPKSHDAADPVYFHVRRGDTEFLYVTDLGIPDSHLRSLLARVHGLMLESNHDVDMLRTGPYPFHLQERILSDQGHLSNEQAFDLVTRHCGDHLRTLVLAHLSAENNAPRIVLDQVRSLRENRPTLACRVVIASREEVGEVITV